MKYLVRIILCIMPLSGCPNPEIILLEAECKNGEFREIYLVKNKPSHENKLRQLLRDFNKDMDTMSCYGRRVFLQPNNDWLDRLDYEKDGCSDIDNMDILLDVDKYEWYDSVCYHFYGDYDHSSHDE